MMSDDLLVLHLPVVRTGVMSLHPGLNMLAKSTKDRIHEGWCILCGQCRFSCKKWLMALVEPFTSSM